MAQNPFGFMLSSLSPHSPELPPTPVSILVRVANMAWEEGFSDVSLPHQVSAPGWETIPSPSFTHLLWFLIPDSLQRFSRTPGLFLRKMETWGQ